jgi:hypothetical protein
MQKSRNCGARPIRYVQVKLHPHFRAVAAFFRNAIYLAAALLVLLSCHAAIAKNTDPSQLKAKADKALALVQKRAAEGKDVSKILPEMQQVKALGDAGKLDQADALLDKILNQLQDGATVVPAKGKNSPPAASGSAKNTAVAASAKGASAPLAAASVTSATAALAEIAMAGAPDHGIFDPSVAGDGTGALYMSLSGVASATPGGTFAKAGVRTYLAVSADLGSSWKLAGAVNPDIGVTLGQAPTNGRWQNEVSALVYDALAPKETRWKLIWHQYLNIDGTRKFEHGWIAYKQASTPGGLAAAKPMKLFTGAAYDAVNDNPAGWTRSPIAGAAVNKMQQLAPALGTCIAASEPGFLSKADALYMSLVCFKSGSAGITNDVFLLKCARPCNAAAPGAWKYTGTALTTADAQTLGLGKFSASDLFSNNGQDFITVSPEGNTPVPGAYQGCNVFRFATIASGKVARDAGGRPIPAASVNIAPGSFNGACSYQPAGANKGLLAGRIDFVTTANGPDANFHILHSNVSP